MIKDLARKLAENRILPVRAELDESEEFPWEIIKEMAAADLFRIFVPAEYEGLGGGCFELSIVMEELSRICRDRHQFCRLRPGDLYPDRFRQRGPKKEIPAGYCGRQKAGGLCPDRIRCRQRCRCDQDYRGKGPRGLPPQRNQTVHH